MPGSPSIPKLTPAYLVQAYSKIPSNRVAWDWRKHNLEMSVTYLETFIVGMDMGQTNVIEISKDKAKQS